MVEVCLVVFFFQAEDGIRDLTVTGVQTCALPISSPGVAARCEPIGPNACASPRRAAVRLAFAGLGPADQHQTACALWPVKSVARRSEERRVGKACRSRWSPYH